ncbi:hypothetical protein [Neobacillus sp. Marseille-QA0830]
MIIRAIVRCLANHSLKREAARAERDIEQLQEEIEERQEQLEREKRKLDRQFEERKRYLENQLKVDQEFLQMVYPNLVLYVGQEMKKRQLFLYKEFFKFSMVQYRQQQQQLEDLIRSIDIDIKQLEDLKESLAAQSDIGPYLDLARLHHQDIPDSKDPALLRKLQELKRVVQEEEGAGPKLHSLNKLITYVLAKNELLKDLQYIQWAIGMKRSNQSLFRKRKKAAGAAARAASKQVQAMNQAISGQMEQLEETACAIRKCWEVPKNALYAEKKEVLEQLKQVDPDDRYQELKEERRSCFERLEGVKRDIQKCYDSQCFDNLEWLKGKKERIHAKLNELNGPFNEIKPFKQKLHEIGQELSHWKARETMVYDQLKQLDIYLMGGKRNVRDRLQA